MSHTEELPDGCRANQSALLRRVSCEMQRVALRAWDEIHAAQGHVSVADIVPPRFGKPLATGMIVEVEDQAGSGFPGFRHGYEGREIEAVFGRSRGERFTDIYAELYLFAVEPFYLDVVTACAPRFQRFSTESDSGQLLTFSQLALPLGNAPGEADALFAVFDLSRAKRREASDALSLHLPLRRALTEQRRPQRLGTISF